MRILSVPMLPQAQQTFAAKRQTGLSQPANSKPVLRSSEPLFGGGWFSLLDKNWNEAKVKRLLNKSGANLEKLDANGNTPLIWACESGHTKLAKKLLARNVNIHFISDNNETAQHVAAQNGHKQVLKALEKHGANFNLQDREGDTALHLSARKGNTDIVRFLLDKGANQDLKNNDDKTASMLAKANGHQHIVNLLEERKQEALRKAEEAKARAAREHARALEKAVEKEARAAEKAAQREALAAQKAEKAEAKLWPLKNLLAAVWDGDTDRIHQSLNAHGQKEDGCFPLFRKTPLVNRMLEGKSSLMVAAERGHLDALHMLILRGAELNQRGGEGKTALSHAAHAGHMPVVEALLDANARVSPQDLRALLKHVSPLKPPALQEKGMSALSRAAAGDDLQGIRKHAVKSPLPEKQADSGLNAFDEQGMTSLMQAAKYGKVQAARVLLDYGADISKRDTQGDTALSHAIRHGQKEVASLLLDRNASVTANDARYLLSLPRVNPDKATASTSTYHVSFPDSPPNAKANSSCFEIEPVEEFPAFHATEPSAPPLAFPALPAPEPKKKSVEDFPVFHTAKPSTEPSAPPLVLPALPAPEPKKLSRSDSSEEIYWDSDGVLRVRDKLPG